MLTQITDASELKPRSIADFVIKMPAAPGNTSSTMVLWQSVERDYPIRMGGNWPVSIPVLSSERLRPIAAPGVSTAAVEPTPMLDLGWARETARPTMALAPLAEVETESAPEPAIAEVPLPCLKWMACAEPEPVASFVAASSCVVPQTREVATLAPAFTVTAELEPLPVPDAPFEAPAVCEHWMRSAVAEPVASFVAASASTAFRACEIAVALPVFEISGELEPLPVPDAPLVAAAQAEPLANFVAPTAIAALQMREAVALPPDFTIAAELEPLPVADAPELCEQWQSMAAEPAARFVEAALVAQTFSLPAALPAVATLPSAVATYVPRATNIRTVAGAEPVAPLVAASCATQPMAKHNALDVPPEVAALFASAAAPVTARPVNGLRAQAVEALITASAAGPMTATTTPRMLPFVLAASDQRTAGTRHSQLAVAAAEPKAAAGKIADLQPLSNIRIAAPELRNQRPIPAIPQPGPLPIEYHLQRIPSTAFSRPEWKSVMYEPLPPHFVVKPALESLEDLLKPKSQQPATLFTMPVRRTRSAVMQHAGRIAAAILLVTSIWLGAGLMGNSTRKVAVREDVSGADAGLATAERVVSADAKQPEAKGPLGWLRRTVADRASVQYTDDFQHGMKSWAANAQTYPAGWQRSADGYVQTGALAIFGPSKSFTDYRMEFFGQIESKSVGWVVRAKDEKNYHAMKFTVVEAGLRPIIAMVHYDVVDGKAGHKVQTPLNVMVHNNRPVQVAVNVRGSHFVTSVDGEEVDTFSDDALPSGGIGFFSDPGERARLYWARVTKNDDWLGHMCAFLSGDSRATAQLRAPALPGQAPGPFGPEGNQTAIAAVSMGLPYIRRRNTRR